MLTDVYFGTKRELQVLIDVKINFLAQIIIIYLGSITACSTGSIMMDHMIVEQHYNLVFLVWFGAN